MEIHWWMSLLITLTFWSPGKRRDEEKEGKTEKRGSRLKELKTKKQQQNKTKTQAIN